MEIIAAMIIYGLAEGIKDNEARTVDLQEQIVDINDDFLRLAAAHSDLHARQKLDHDTHHAKIDANKQAIDGMMDALDAFAEADK
jgi:molecular chaperone GrpE (heat shock protein)